MRSLSGRYELEVEPTFKDRLLFFAICFVLSLAVLSGIFYGVYQCFDFNPPSTTEVQTTSWRVVASHDDGQYLIVTNEKVQMTLHCMQTDCYAYEPGYRMALSKFCARHLWLYAKKLDDGNGEYTYANVASDGDCDGTEVQ